MKPDLIRIARNLTPPIAWRMGASFYRKISAGKKYSAEEGAERDGHWYDKMYDSHEGYRDHYTVSSYYFMWSVIADRLIRGGCRSVLDIGCGPGQFASLLRDKGMPRYCGIDLSTKAVQWARALCPAYTFMNVSVFETDIFETLDYDVVVSLEFLEHINEDLVVLSRIPNGKRFLGSVPSFPDISHVRHFANCDEVRKRYGQLFDSFTVEAFPCDEDRTYVWYLCEGVKR